MNFFILSAIINAFIAGLLGIVVILRNRKEIVNKLFFGLSMAVVFWSISYWQWMSSASDLSALFWARLLSIGALFIPVFYFHWVLAFTNLHIKKSNLIKLVYFLIFIICAFSFSDFFIKGVEQKFIFSFWPIPGFFYHSYVIFIFFGLTAYSLFLLFKQYTIKIGDEKTNIKYIIIGSLIGFSGGLTNFFIWYNIPIFPYGNFLVAIYPITLAVASFKHQLFNIKVIATELLTFIIWIFLFIRLLLSQTTQDWIINGGLLVFVIISGVLLIRSVLQEVKQREELEKLSVFLKDINLKLNIKTNYLTALQDFTASIIETLDLKAIIQSIVDGISDRFGYIGVLLVLVSEDGKTSYPAAISKNKLTEIALKILPEPLGVYGKAELENDSDLSAVAIKTDKVQIDEDFSNFFSAVPKNISKLIQRTLGIKTVVAIPVRFKGRVFGVLDIASKKPKSDFSSEELDVLKTLANQIGIILNNANLFEKVKKLSAHKSELLSIVAHQIKNPLAVMKGYASLLADKTIKGPKTTEETAGKIISSANKLLKTLNNLLDFHHIEEGRMHYEFQKLELNSLLKEIINDFQIVVKQKSLNLIFEQAPSEAFVSADIYKLSQAFQNLIDNAIKYTNKGWIKISLNFVVDNEKQESVLIVISDSGRGISSDLIGKLFGKFQRGVREKEILGTGLGLYVCKEIIEAHQGKVWVESDGEGKGSRFYVRLPKA